LHYSSYQAFYCLPEMLVLCFSLMKGYAHVALILIIAIVVIVLLILFVLHAGPFSAPVTTPVATPV